MNEDRFFFDEMIMSIFGGGEPDLNWNGHKYSKGRSADVLCSLLWSSTAEVPQALCDLTGKRAKTYGQLVQRIRPARERANDPRQEYDRDVTPANRLRRSR